MLKRLMEWKKSQRRVRRSKEMSKNLTVSRKKVLMFINPTNKMTSKTSILNLRNQVLKRKLMLLLRKKPTKMKTLKMSLMLYLITTSKTKKQHHNPKSLSRKSKNNKMMKMTSDWTTSSTINSTSIMRSPPRRKIDYKLIKNKQPSRSRPLKEMKK